MRPNRSTVFALLFIATAMLIPALAAPVRAAEPKSLSICGMASPEELAQLYRKKLYPTKQEAGCFWSLKPGGMAYLHIEVHKFRRELRKYFRANLPPTTKLVEIKDLGDGGLVSVSEGQLGVVIIRKGDYVLRSAVTFLDIKPGSPKQKVLWTIYKRILDKLG